jgi:8-oxo-dGTP pyrophosphatase MutT (NUDIX family)
MKVPAPRSAPQDAAWSRLLDRLAGTLPTHDLQSVRIGAGLADTTDPRLLQLIPQQLRHAAVLIGLVDSAETPGVLLTVRAGHLRQHAGQISFPGGVIETTDSGPAAAALREAQEEVGLDAADAEIIGYLPDQIVLTGFRITPVVAHIAASFTPRPDAAEVQSAFMLPFMTLLDSASERQGVRTLAGIEVVTRDLQFGEHRIWGATAGMLFALRSLALS